MTRVQGTSAGLWRRSALVLTCGCLITILAFGPRTTMGLLLPSITRETGWTHDIFAFAIGIQHIIWGVGQPFGGIIADRLGSVPALWAGSILYSAGLLMMANAATPAAFYFAGALIGLGLSGASYNIVLAVFGKLVPEHRRPLATGIGAAAGSFGQFFFSPLCVLLLDLSDWRTTLLTFSAMLLLILPLSLPMRESSYSWETKDAANPGLTVRQVFREALQHRLYVLLITGILISGFHVAFINMHLPAYLQDGGLTRTSAGWVIASIGLFNIFGSVAVGWLCRQYPDRYVLALIYFLRAFAMAWFMVLPLSLIDALLFGAAMGLLWTSAIVPVADLITRTFGHDNLATLYGLAYFFHQVGAFFGVWVGALMFEHTGSYDLVWWILVVAALISAALTFLIRTPGAPRPQIKSC
jgi:predicted MFS family arabinose efflux permease